MKKVFFTLFALCAIAWGVDFNVRQIDVDCDISYNSEFPDIEFYQWEQATINFNIKRGRSSVAIPSTAYPVFRAWLAADPSTLYVASTGTVESASSGRVQNVLAPSQTGMTNTTYESACTLYNSDGSLNGVIWRGDLVVNYAPNSSGLSYVGTSPALDLDAATTAETDTALRLAPDGAGGVEWAVTAGGGGSGDLTEVQVTGGLLSVSSGTGPIPSVGLTTNAVTSAVAAAWANLDTDSTDDITSESDPVFSAETTLAALNTRITDATLVTGAHTVDTDTTYTAGTNLTLNGTVFSLDSAAQSSDDLADSALQPGDSAGGDLTGTYPNPTISSAAFFGTGSNGQHWTYDAGSYGWSYPALATATGVVATNQMDFGAGTDGYVWTSDGAGAEAWEAIPGAATVTNIYSFAISDESTELAAAAGQFTMHLPAAMTLQDIRLSMVIAPTGSVFTVDVNEAGSTILSTKLSVDATETTSETAATAAVISDSSLADDAIITVDIDAVGSTFGGAGAKIHLYYTNP